MIDTLYALTSEQIERRRSFLGASEAKIVMEGSPEDVAKLIAIKRGERKPDDLSLNRAVQMGHVTEPLNRFWYTLETGTTLTRVGEPPVRFEEADYIAVTLDGFDPELEAPFEAKYHGGFETMDDLIDRYFWQLQQQMLVTDTQHAVLSVIYGLNSRYEYRMIAADPVSQMDLKLRARNVWKCVLSGEPWPELRPITAGKAEIKAYKTVDMSTNNAFADAAARFLENQVAAKKFAQAKVDLKSTFPDDALKVHGFGVIGTRDRTNKIVFRAEAEPKND